MRDEAYPCGAENSVYSDEKLERYAMKKAFQNDDDMTVLNDTREATVMEGRDACRQPPWKKRVASHQVSVLKVKPSN